MARLSVNLNKIALLRNSRRTGVPDVLALRACRRTTAGAHGITIHPRPDERHIRRADVPALAALIAPWRPGFEFNIEGYPDPAFLDLVATRGARAGDAGARRAGRADLGGRLAAGARTAIAAMRAVVARLHAHRSRVILFVDPDPAAVAPVAETGADGVEIYTGGYAAAFRAGDAGDAARRLCRDGGGGGGAAA